MQFIFNRPLPKKFIKENEIAKLRYHKCIDRNVHVAMQSQNHNTVIGRGLCASSLSPSLKLHCIAMTTIFTQNDHFFQTWPFWLKAEQINLFQSIWSDLKKWSFWVKIVVIAMQCNAISMKVTSLMRIDSQYVHCKCFVCCFYSHTYVCQRNSQTTLSNFNSLIPVIKKRWLNAVFTVLQNGFLHVFVCNFWK